jgi:CarD family transcriptional regulator
MFSLSEKIVYPGHGVAQINCIVEKNVGGKVTTFYELRFLHKEMTILIPTENLSAVGIRKLSTKANLDDILKVLSEPIKKINYQELAATNWNKRSKQYLVKLKSGDILEISKIYRELQCMAQQKELSFGERNLLLQTEELLSEEVSLIKNVVEEEAVELLRSFFVQPQLQQKPVQIRAYL